METERKQLKVDELAGRIRFSLIGILDQDPARFQHLAPALEKAGADLLKSYAPAPRCNDSAGGAR